VIDEIKWAMKAFPQTKEFFFDDDTFTDNLPRAEEIARELGKLGVTWSCNAKANVPRKTLKILKDGGLRLLLVGYESGNQQILHNIKKGMRIEVAEQFTKDCQRTGHRHPRHLHHGPARRDARDHAADRGMGGEDQPAHHSGLPGRALSPAPSSTSRRWRTAGSTPSMPSWWTSTASRSRRCTTPHLSHTEIFNSVETFYKSFYFRPRKIGAIVSEMVRSPDMMKRRLREGVEFL